MKLGVIYCCYGNPEYIDDCLDPWIEAKKTNNILIAAVHGQFKEYHELGIPDNDIESIRQLSILYREGNKIENLYVQNHYSSFTHYQSEAEIRDKGLQWLLQQNCDYIWLLDNDEFYTVGQINNIINYIQKEEFIDWFSILFKNYIFSGREWISGFCPPRIFKVNLLDKDLKLNNFYWDNDVKYLAGINCKLVGDTTLWSYKGLSNKSIPNNLLSGGIKHLTWLHTNGKLKYEYQMKHFGHCGYKWNYDTNQLEFNLEFHQKNNIPLPEINYESRT